MSVSQKQLDSVLLGSLMKAARAAGLEAVEKLQVQAMVVYEADVLSGKRLPNGKSWYVADGVCGFAWVKVFGLRGNKLAAFKGHGFSAAYGGGVSLWVSEFNQSMQKKEAFADAFAKVLRDAGYKAYSGSRMD